MSYIKCVTSPNDFAVSRFAGIPDEYDGKVLVKQQAFTGALTLTTPTTHDNYYVLAPIPDVAYLQGSCVPGSESSIVWTAVQYADVSTLFPAASESEVVNAFRYASNAIEIVPTVNSMTWGGAVEVWKTNIGMTVNIGTADVFAVEGLSGAIASVKPSSVMPFNHGCYSVTASTNSAFPFVPIMDGQAYSKLVFTNSTQSVTSAGNFLGFGNQETVIVKVPLNAASNSALIRTWSCVEYQVNSSSLMWDFAHMSAPYDPVALKLAKEYMQSQPVAVPYFENANFWQNFLKWVSTISGALRVIPGPVGDVAGVAQLISKTASMYV